MSAPKKKEEAKHDAGPAPSNEDFANKYLQKKQDLEVDKFFRALVKLEGSDLHMKVGRPPCVRVRNDLRPLNVPPITTEAIEFSV